MLTPSFSRQTVSCTLSFFFAANLSAQSSQALHRFDTKIDSFFAAKQRDSFIYYAEAKAYLAKQTDSLALWGWTKRKVESFIFKDTKEALAYNLKTFQDRWREPSNPDEWEPFLRLQCNRGYYQLHLGQIAHSIQSYESAAQLYEKYKYHFLNFNTASLYKPLGNNYTRLGDNDKAIAVFQKAIAVGGSYEDMSGLYANIGIAYWNKGEYVVAEENYRKGLNLPDISDANRGFLLGRLAETMLDLGRVAEAARTAAEAIRVLRPDGPDDKRALEYRARARRVAGVANTRLGKYAEAERLLTGALADDGAASGEYSREVGKDHIAFSKLLLRQGRPLPALQAADRALYAVIPDFNPVNSSTINQSANPPPNKFYEENTIFEALTAKAEAAQALFEKDGDTGWLILALECHDLAWQAESILRRVFQYSSSKLHLQKDTRAREEAAMNLARLLFEKTGQAVWLEKAFAIAERSKAALLLESLQDNLVRQRLSGSDLRFGQLTALRQSLSYFDKNLLLEPKSDNVAQWRIEADGIRSQIAALEQSLRKEYPSLFAVETNTANWLPVPTDFSEGEALVGYFVSEHWLDVFVFQKDKPNTWDRIPNNIELQGLIRRYLAFFENDFAILNDPAGYFQTAHALWQKLLPPETALASVLTILPDGILNFVPFEALVTTADGAPTLRNAAYLIRQKEVRYAWSLAVLRQQKNLKSRASRYLLSVAPGFANRERGLAPLAASDFDWSGITGWDIQNLKGQNADLNHFLKAADGYRVLHFSTHAFAGENPRIEFSDSSMLLPDLYALPLQADLVVLSACQTGLGKEEKGEGVMSLARAFAQAGAACIVSSLWSVNDQSTSRLMRFFYENIGAGKTSSAALREAKLAYLADLEIGNAAQSPYFWAGLVAVGDDRPVAQPWGWGAWGLLLAVAVLLFAGWRFWQKRN